MGILFVMPNWKSYSEVWMHRMIEVLKPHIAAIAAGSPQERTWEGTPVIPLDRLPLWRLGVHKLAPRVFPAPNDLGTLTRAFSRSSVTCALVHYLDFALKFESVWQQADKPVFVHCHGYDTTWNLRSDNPPYHTYFGADYPEAVRRLSQRVILIANSYDTANRLFEIGVDKSRVVVKYFGVPINQTPPKRHERTKDINILYLGRLIDCKGPNVVIEAFNTACDRGLEGSLIMAGDGELRLMCEVMRLRSRYADRIHLLGAVGASQAQSLYEQADIFTSHCCQGPFTHQVEAFGVSIVEAMAAALPVVTGRSGGVTETVVQGQTGILVDPGDAEAHAAAFLGLAADPQRRSLLGSAGRQRAAEMFNPDQERTSLLKILGY